MVYLFIYFIHIAWYKTYLTRPSPSRQSGEEAPGEPPQQEWEYKMTEDRSPSTSPEASSRKHRLYPGLSSPIPQEGVRHPPEEAGGTEDSPQMHQLWRPFSFVNFSPNFAPKTLSGSNSRLQQI